MQLQQFVTEIIEELGGLVEPIEFALCNVLIPEEYTSYFQNKSEILLAFDFEVAQENPEAEFVTFGSYILEQALTIIHERAISTIRFAEVERLEIGNPLKKLTEFLKDESGKVTILEEKPVLGAWAVFQYNVAYVSDEKTDSYEEVWINLLTNEICSTMQKEQNRIVYNDAPLYTYPMVAPLDLSKPVETAIKYVKQKAEQQNKDVSKTITLEKDITRITNYYNELLKENEKRANRKGLSEDKKKEIASKTVAIELEKDKQLQEIYNKYNGQIEINLDNIIMYIIPLLEFTININFRNELMKKTIYFNPITKLFLDVV